MSSRLEAHFPGRDGRIVATLTLALLLLLLMGFGYLLVDKWQWAEETRENIAPRHARLLGLRELGEPLAQARAALATELTAAAHPAEVDLDRIGADVQERVRRLASAAGLTISGSQILPARKQGSFVELPLKISLSGNMEALRELLDGLDRERPVVLVDQLEIHNQLRRVRRGATPQQGGVLVIQLSVSVLRLQS